MSGITSAASKMLAVARTSNTVLGVPDIGKMISCTGTWTQTFSAAATLANGWFCYLANEGSGVITLDPNASETIGGVTTADMNPGDVWLVQCDGSNLGLRRLVGNNKQIITSGSGNFTVPAGVYRLFAECWGGGGGTKNANYTCSGGGAYSAGWINTTPAATIAYAVGAAGVGGASYTAGGNTTFGALTANGGASGITTFSPAVGGTASGGDINLPGGDGYVEQYSPGSASLGGSSPRGAGSANTGNAGKVPGGGGGSNSQNGAAGLIVVTWI